MVKKLLSAISVFLFFTSQLSAQALTGTKNIPGDYATLASAITDLNSKGVGLGGVTFNIAASYSEYIAVTLSVTATGTATNPIVFQKSGGGANPLIRNGFAGTNTPATATQDGLLRFIGSDYVTLDGIDFTDTCTVNPNTMEYGIAFFKASTTDGCQNNTVKNCTITLNRINNVSGATEGSDGSSGIISMNCTFSTQTASLVPIAFSGTNSYNRYYSNTIQNCNTGIYLRGYNHTVSPYGLYDQGNDVGGASAATGNTIKNFGGGGAVATAYGIRTIYNSSVNVSYNTLNNNDGAGVNHTAVLRGIFISTAVNANVDVSYNTVTLKGGGNVSLMACIENGGGATGTSNTVNINGNIITNCTYAAATSAQIDYIVNTANSFILNMNNNKLLSNATANTSNTISGVKNTGAVTNTINMNGNKFDGFSNTGAGSSAVLNFISNSGGTATTTLNINADTLTNAITYSAPISTGAVNVIINTGIPLICNITNNRVLSVSVNSNAPFNFINNSYSVPVTYNGATKTITGNQISGLSLTYASGTGAVYGYNCISASSNFCTINISNNKFTSIALSGTSRQFNGIFNSDGVSAPYPDVTINNNKIDNVTGIAGVSASYCIYNVYANNLTISGDTVTNITNSGSGALTGIYQGNTTSTTAWQNMYNNVVGNILSSGTATVYGIYNLANNTNTYKNRIFNLNGSNASTIIYGMFINSGLLMNVYNNLIGDLKATASTNANAINGIQIANSLSTNFVNVYHNTVYLNATSIGATFGTAGIYVASTGSVVKLRNNIIVNTSTSPGAGSNGVAACFKYSASPATTAYHPYSNHNLFWAGTPSATKLIFCLGVGGLPTSPQQTLAAYKAFITSSRDANSISQAPVFLSTTGTDPNFLHIDPTMASNQIESGGSSRFITEFTDDADGDTRGSYPDIGADEFSGTMTDLVGPTILVTALANTGNTGNRTITATISDVSGVATGSDAPRIYFKKMWSGTWYNANATSVSGDQYTFTITAATMGGLALNDSVYYYFAAQDLVGSPNLSVQPYGATGIAASGVTPPGNVTPPGFSTPSAFVYKINVAPLNGTYVVGAGGACGAATYATLNAAITDYNAKGMSGPVTFLLSDATYTISTQIVINPNNDASATNTLTIKPCAGVTSLITTSTLTVPIFQIQNARYVIIDGSNTAGGTTRDLTISNTNATAATAAVFYYSTGVGSGCKNDTIKNCNILMGADQSTGTTSTYGICIGGTTVGSAGFSNDSIGIVNNNITKCRFGIYNYGGNGSILNQSTYVANNIIGPASFGSSQIGAAGIIMREVQNAIIKNNEIRFVGGEYANTTAGADRVGIAIAGVTTTYWPAPAVAIAKGIQITGNLIHDIVDERIFNANAIVVAADKGMVTGNTIANNFIYNIKSNGTGGKVSSGIGIGSGNGDAYVFNTIHLYGDLDPNASATAPATNFPSCVRIDNANNNINLSVKNNIGVNNGYSSSVPTARFSNFYYPAGMIWGTGGSNYNDWFYGIDNNDSLPLAAFSNVGLIGSTYYTTLAQFQTGSGQEANSKYVNPYFLSYNNLHITNIDLNNAGVSVAGITNDYDNSVRGGTPDIGADEIDPVSLDAGITEVNSNSTILCGTTVTATIKNHGSTTLSSATINWMVNGVSQTPYSWSGSLSTGATDVATLGTFAFTPGTKYTIKVYTSSPNGGTDLNIANDSTVRTNLYPNMSGTYTVGSGGNFTTLTAAVTALNSYGICGPVVLSLTDALYSTSETYPISINAISGASAVNTITIKPASGVNATITGNSTSSILKLNGADYVTVDGSNNGSTSRNLTIENTNTATSGNAVIHLSSPLATNTATYNTIKNCVILGNATNTTVAGIVTGGASGISSALSSNRNNSITNNKISKVQNGVYLFGPSAVNFDSSNVVANNKIGDVSDSVGIIGIYMTMQYGATVSGNEIQNVTPVSNSTISGIRINESRLCTISQNKIHKLKYLQSASSSVIGIGITATSLNSATYPASNSIVNNLVYDLQSFNAGSGTTNWNAMGIGTTASYGDMFYHNSVYITGNLGGGNAMNGCFVNGSSLLGAPVANGVQVRNNIFQIKATTSGAATRMFGVYANAPLTGVLFSNNIIRSEIATGGSAFNTAYTGYYNGILCNSLPEWQAACGSDNGSYDIDPLFTSSTDLHINAGATPSAVEDGAATGLGVSIDYENDSRPDNNALANGGGTGADIGADEYDGVPANVMTVSAVRTTQNTTVTAQGLTQQQVVGVQVITTGERNPLNLSQLDFNTNGSTVAADITNARLYYTYNRSLFDTTLQVGSTVSAPSGAYSFTLNQNLTVADTFFFWLTYDISPTATIGDVVDAECTNATISTGSYTPSPTAPAGNRPISGPMCGSYTVGTSGAYDFPTITSAITNLNTRGISCAVTLLLKDALYSTGETFPLIINQITGSSAVNTITMKPDVGVNAVITGSNLNSILMFNTTDYFTLDGSNSGGSTKNLTIENSQSYYLTQNYDVIRLIGGTNGASNITIKNCIVKTYSPDYVTQVGAPGNVAATYGITTGSLTSPGGNADNCDTLQILNNTILKTGIPVRISASLVGNQLDSLVISNNEIGSILSSESVHIPGGTAGAIGVQNVNRVNISNNHIFNTQQGVWVAFPVGVYLMSGVTNAVVSKNRIHGFGVRLATAASYGAAGIYVATGVTPSNITISNNIIYDVYGTGAAALGTGMSRGIHLGSSMSNINVYHNSVNMYGNALRTGATVDVSSAIFIESTVSVIDMINNTFNNKIVSTGSPAGQKSYAIYSLAANTAFTATTNNNHYDTTGTQGVLGFLGVAQGDLAAWKTAMGGSKDAAAISGDPLFNNDTLLVGLTGSPLTSAGAALPAVADDYLGALRSGTTPTPGAYEIIGDVIPPVITYTLISNTVSTANYVLNNFATVTDAATPPVANVRLYYKKSTDANAYVGNTSSDNGWKYVNATGSSPYSFTIDYSIINGGSVTGGDEINYFVVAEDAVVTPNPNVGINAGVFATTPTASLLTGANFPVTGVNSYFIANPINGTLVVNNVLGPFFSLTGNTGAFKYINANAINGDLVIEVQTNTTEDGTYSLNTVTNVGGPFNIFIRPSNNTVKTLSGTVADCMIKYNGADRVVVDGRDPATGTGNYLTFINYNTSNSTICYYNDATLDTMRNTTVKSANSSTSTGVPGTSNAQGALYIGKGNVTGNDSLVFRSNIFTNIDATNIPVTNIYNEGTSTIITNDALLIDSNEIANFYVYGILASTGVGPNWTINSNSFYNNIAGFSYSGTFQIRMEPGATANNTTINYNYLGGNAAWATGTYLNSSNGASVYNGIRVSLGNTIASNIQGNVIKNINLTGSGAGLQLTGINITSSGKINVGTTAPNFIGDTAVSGSITIAGTTNCFGILSQSTDTVNIKNNYISGITLSNVSASTYNAIDARNGAYTISGNIIGHPTAADRLVQNGTGTITGIATSGTATFDSVYNNQIRGIYCSNVSNSTFAGISIGGVAGNVVRIYNNTIGSSSSNNNIRMLGAGTFTGITHSSVSTDYIIRDNMLQGIYMSNAGSTTFNGITNTSASSAGKVTGNSVGDATNINSITCDGTGTFTGFQVNGTKTYLENNVLAGVNLTNAGNYTFNGMLVQGTGGDTLINNQIGSGSIANSIRYGGSGTIYGFYKTSSGAFISLFNGNNIQGVAMSGTGASNFYGFYSNTGTGYCVLSNNTVGHSTTADMISHAGTGTFYGFNMTNLAGTLNMQNNIMAGINRTSATGSNTFGIYTSGATPDTLINNVIGSPSIGNNIKLAGNGAFYGINKNTGSTAPSLLSNNAIQGVNLSNAGVMFYGIYVTSGVSSIITGNTIGHATTPDMITVSGGTGTPHYGIYNVLSSGTSSIIRNNVIAGLTISSGHFTGIYASGTGNDSVEYNSLGKAGTTDNIKFTAGGNFTGIQYVSTGSGGSSVYNNLITGIQASNILTTGSFSAINRSSVNGNGGRVSRNTIGSSSLSGAITWAGNGNSSHTLMSVSGSGAMRIDSNTIGGINFSSTSSLAAIQLLNVGSGTSPYYPQLSGNAIGASGSVNNIEIAGNQSLTAYNIAPTTSTNQVQVDNNSIAGISMPNSSNSAAVTIFSTSIAGNVRYINNTVGDLATGSSIGIAGSGTFTGFSILSNSTSASVFNGNKVFNVNLSNATATASRTVISFSGATATTYDSVYSNEVRYFTSNSSGAHTIIGLTLTTSGAASVTNNSIRDISATNISGANAFSGMTVTGKATISLNTFGSLAASSISFSHGNTLSSLLSYTGSNIHTISGNILSGVSESSTSTTLGFSAVYVTGGTSTIQSNTISNITSNNLSASVGFSASLIGINLTAAGTGHIISDNVITNLTASNASNTGQNVYGINNQGGGTFTRNRIDKLYNSNSAGGGVLIGIRSATSSTTEISNNMISLGYGEANTLSISGIEQSSTGGQAIYHNSVNIGGIQSSGSTNSYGYVRIAGSTATVNVKNNVFYNKRTGGSGFHYTIANLHTTPATGWAANASNNNDLYSASGAVGVWNTNTNLSFASWKTTSSSDAASKNDLPVFLNDTNDLHVDSIQNLSLSNTGANIGAVAIDRDGKSRNGAAPDLGADEFDLTTLRIDTTSYEVTSGCPVVSGTGWFHFLDASGKLVFSINPNGNNLGATCWGVRIDTAGIRTDMIDYLGTVYKGYYLDRNFYIMPTFQPSTPVSIRYYALAAEMAELRDSVNNYLGGGTKVITDLYVVSKFHHTTGSDDLEPRNNQATATDTVKAVYGAINAYGSDYYNEFTVNDFSEFVMSYVPMQPNAPLPVTWLSFTAKASDPDALLYWSTGTERNADRFDVQRSTNGYDWTTIGQVKAAGNSNSIQYYAFTDASVASKYTHVYYRIKQLDMNGKFAYSGTRDVQFSSKGMDIVNVAPNPFTNRIGITYQTNLNGTVSVRILDLMGRVVAETAYITVPGINTFGLNTESLAAGTYLICTTQNGIQHYSKIVKQ